MNFNQKLGSGLIAFLNANKNRNGTIDSIPNATVRDGVDFFETHNSEQSRVPTLINAENLTDISSLIVEKENDREIQKWKISNCADFETAFKYLNSSNLKEQLSTDTVLFIKFKIDEHFSGLASHQSYEISKTYFEKSLVISFEAINCLSYKIYWKLQNNNDLLELELYGDDFLKQEISLFEFIENFLILSLSNGHLGLQRNFELKHGAYKVQIHLLADARNYNLLLLACESGNYSVAENLLNKGISSEIPNSRINAQNLAYKEGHFNVLEILVKANIPFPEYFSIEKCSDDFKKFYVPFETLHKMIIVRNKSKVEEIVVTNPGYRFFYNSKNESALKTALTNNCFEMYELLLSLQVFFGPHEDAEVMVEKFSDEERAQLRDINFRYFKGSPEKHINILLANSFIVHELCNWQEKLQHLQRAFRVLNDNPNIRSILMTVAASKNFRLIFDFNRDSVQLIDPTADSYTNGIFYLNGRIYIGAKQLLDPATEHETFATMAHEMCHYAMNVTYNNLARPYKAKDKQAAEDFEQILQNCYENRSKEEFIDTVFEHYPKEMHHAELIVRPPHLMALHYNNTEKIEESRQNFPELFANFENKVVPEMKRALPEVENRAEKIIQEKEKIISRYKKLLFLSILIIFVAALMGYNFYDPKIKFDDLSHADKEKIKSATVRFEGTNIKFKDIYADDSEAYHQLTSDDLKRMLKGKIFHIDSVDYLHLSWFNLTLSLKQKIENSTFIFQNETVAYSSFNVSHASSFDALTSNQIIDVLSDKKLRVGTMISNRTEFFIKRKFFPESAISVLSDYRKLQLRFMENSQTTFMPPTENPRYQPILLPGGIVNTNIEQTGPRINVSFEEYYLKHPKNSLEFKNDDNTLNIEGFSMHNSLKGWFVNNLAAQTETYQFLHKTFDDIMTQVQEKRIFILSSEAGAGKTVAFEQLAMTIKQTHPHHWVSYIPLKGGIKLYEKFVIKDGEVVNFLENLLNLNPNDTFEKEFFKNSWASNDVVLLWDGFDEISPTFTKYIMDVLEYIYKYTNNSQYICTRPLYASKLSSTFKTDVYKIVSFTEYEKDEFLRKFYKTKNLTDDEINERTQKVMDLVKSFEYQPPNEIVPRKLNTPLMLMLIAEAQDGEHKFETVNFYHIFQKFVKKKYEIWNEKSEINKNITLKAVSAGGGFTINQIFQKYAILSYLPVWTFIYFQVFKDAQILRKEIPDELKTEDITAIGILFINGPYRFEFAHKTFTEYFIVDYLKDNVYATTDSMSQSEAHARLELLFMTFKIHARYQTILSELLSSFLKSSEAKRKGRFTKEIKDVLVSTYKYHLISYLTEGQPILFEIFGEFFKTDHNLLVDLLRIYEDKTFYTEIFNPLNEVYFMDPQHIAEKLRKYLNNDELEHFLHGRDQKAVILFGMYYYSQSKLPKFHETLKITDQMMSFWDFYDAEIKPNCTDNELKQLFLSPGSAAMYMDFSERNYEKFWSEANELLNRSEISIVFGNLYNYLFEIVKNIPDFNETMLLDDVLNDTESLLDPSEIIEMFQTSNILHKVIYSSNAFDTVWKFLSNFSDVEQRRELLMKNDTGSFLYRVTTGAYRKRYFHGRYFLDYFHYFDHNPNNLFINSLIVNDQTNRNLNLESFALVSDVYHQHFSVNEMQEMVLKSNDFMLRLIDHAPEESSKQFEKYLRNLFKGKERELKGFMERKLGDTNFSVLEIFKGFEHVRGGKNDRAKNMKVFRELYDDLKPQVYP